MVRFDLNILLTGATGFVGKAVHQKLIHHSVRLSSRNKPMSQSDHFFKKTISSTEDFSDCLDNVDFVIQKPARVHQMNDKSKDPLFKFMETNCSGTLNVARQVAKIDIKRLVFLSSI